MRTELLVLITPHVIRDQRDARALTEDLRSQLINAGLVPQQVQQPRQRVRPTRTDCSRMQRRGSQLARFERSSAGFALLIVLWTLVLIAFLVLHLTASGRTEIRIASNLRRQRRRRSGSGWRHFGRDFQPVGTAARTALAGERAASPIDGRRLPGRNAARERGGADQSQPRFAGVDRGAVARRRQRSRGGPSHRRSDRRLGRIVSTPKTARHVESRISSPPGSIMPRPGRRSRPSTS